MKDAIEDWMQGGQENSDSALNLHEADPLEAPTFEMNLDANERDEFLEEFEEAYEDLEEKVDDVLSDWDDDRRVIDDYYWNRKLVPLIDEGAKLDERFLRTVITWVVDGTKINGEPLEDVMPEIKQLMIDNYDPNGMTFSEKFQLHTLNL